MADRTTLGLVSRLYADTHVILDGDGGFSLCTSGSQHVFKPVSVHTLWAVLQTLHKACSQAQRYNHFAGGTSHRWVDFYEQRIDSDRSCLNEWHLLPDVESRRPPSPDQMLKPRERAETERLIRSTLKEVMMVLDLDVVTSKDIRKKVEVDLGMDLTSFKSFIDEEMLTILGQMDGASYIFDHVYLGSEWNAANMEELQRNGVGHILNVTREIDNFFPGQFEYLNIRVYDDEATELLKHWDRTFKFISRALDAGSKVLVHCKMGVSRSASVVVAYAMKAYDWDLAKALHHVKMRRSCVKPNASFMEQLKIYAGILDASRQRHNKLWRSKSESNLKHEAHHDASVASATAAVPVSAPSTVACSSYVNSPSALVPLLPSVAVAASLTNASVQVGTDSVDSAGPTAASPVRPALSSADSPATQPTQSSMEVSVQVLDVSDANRPKSWSPDDSVVGTLFPPTPIATCEQSPDSESLQPGTNRSVGVSLRVPCGNGRTYSVSQNRCTLLNRASQLGSSPALASDDQENASTASWIRDEFWRTSESVDWMTSPSTELLDCINTALLLNGWHNADMENKASDDLSSLPRVGSVKDRIFEFETATSVQPANAYLWRPPVPVASSAVVHEQNPPLSQQQPPPCRLDRSGLVLNLASQFGTVASTTVSSSPEGDAETANPISGWSCGVPASDSEGPVVSQVKPAPLRHQAVLVRLTQDEKQPPPDYEERPVRSWTDSTNSETWNPLCSGSSLPCVGTADADLVLSSTDGLGSGWMTSYASDPTLPAAFLCDSARSLELAEVSSDVQSTSPPLGVVRMQLEALESQQRLPMAVAPRARRSLPDEFTKTATCLNRTADTTQPLNHGVSETAAGAGARTSVSRLRKELEAKAVLPLTGSVAPHPSVKAVVESSQAARTSPVRSSPPTPAFTTLRKRSLSVDKLNYRAIVFNRKGRLAQSSTLRRFSGFDPRPRCLLADADQSNEFYECSTLNG